MSGLETCWVNDEAERAYNSPLVESAHVRVYTCTRMHTHTHTHTLILVRMHQEDVDQGC